MEKFNLSDLHKKNQDNNKKEFLKDDKVEQKQALRIYYEKQAQEMAHDFGLTKKEVIESDEKIKSEIKTDIENIKKGKLKSWFGPNSHRPSDYSEFLDYGDYTGFNLDRNEKGLLDNKNRQKFVEALEDILDKLEISALYYKKEDYEDFSEKGILKGMIYNQEIKIDTRTINDGLDYGSRLQIKTATIDKKDLPEKEARLMLKEWGEFANLRTDRLIQLQKEKQK